MRLAWLTDIHLDFVTPARFAQLCDDIQATHAERVLIGGDIAQADDFATWLEAMADAIDAPIHFVLGNHDYYGGDIATTRQRAASLTARRGAEVGWIPEQGPIALSETTALIGHGGWGDARLGDFMGSTVMLNDYIRIHDLLAVASDKEALKRALIRQGQEAAAILRRHLTEALEIAAEGVLLTHVPPFHGACWHEGEISDNNWLPHFSCGTVGEMLVEVMQGREERLTVLCGHTHSPGCYTPLPNVEVLTAGAVYREPVVDRILTVA